ncbi:alpha/beta fold hydrolase [Streptacidiphilus rugosus]|uniref:alpha/beta fold hydrolase n=1 Tax=Streptacidiphilus rugosus TaxID=405783 RepID=UPI00055EE75C|nr:alpha/beta hydrolase [Streptacidiphilus rugosus]
MNTRKLTLSQDLDLTFTEFGDPEADEGAAVLMLHGGAGPGTLIGFATALSARGYVVAPTHPGFDRTPRPEGFDSVADLATAYLDLLDALGLSRVTVVGSSLGGWIAAEMALRDNHGVIDSLVIVNAAGIRAEPGQGVTDLTGMSPAEISLLSFHRAEFRPDPTALDDERRAVVAANQRALSVYSGGPSLEDPKLRGRLHRVRIPVLVLWGEHDGVIPTAYGRTFAASFPRARFVPVAEAGHFPFIENPEAVFAALDDFAESRGQVMSGTGSVA